MNIVAVVALAWPQLADAFEGRIATELVRGTETTALLYTVGPEHLRIEVTGSDWPHPVNLVNLESGAVTLVFPHNRTFVRLKAVASNPSTRPGFPAMPPGIGPQPPTTPQPPSVAGPTNLPGTPAPAQVPALPQPPGGLPPGIGPQTGNNPAIPQPPAVGPQAGNQPAFPQFPPMPATPGLPAAAGMPALPMFSMPGEKLELEATSETRTILGFDCVRYVLKRRGETMEIWATDKLLPFQPWLQNQPSRFGPRMIEEQWGGMLKEKKLFPLLMILKFEGGPERMRFEVKSVTPGKIADEKQFGPPADYHELQPLPF